MTRRTVTREEWLEEGERLFGADMSKWKFKCPSCGHVASVGDWYKAGASSGHVAFSCIGRFRGSKVELGGSPGPCNYAGGGLFKLNPVTVAFGHGSESQMFEFAKEEKKDGNHSTRGPKRKARKRSHDQA